MPTPPVYGGPKVNTSALPNARVSTNVPLEAFGGGQSLENVVSAGQGFLKVVQEEKQKADEIAVLEADTKAAQLKNNMFYDPQNGAMTRKGKDAMAAVGDYTQQFNTKASEIRDSLSNDNQKALFQRKLAAHSLDLDNQLQKHAFVEGEKYYNDVADANVKAYTNQAISNYQDPNAVESAIAQQRDTIFSHAKNTGVAESVAEQNFSEVSSKTRTEVVQRMLANGDTATAQKYYTENKDKFLGDDPKKMELALQEGKVLDTSIKAWGSVQHYRLPDGNPDESKMQSDIMARTDISPEEKEKVWSYVKAKSSEQFANKSKRDSANERSFLNNVAGMKQSGSAVEDALRQVNQYAIDDYDKTLKETAVKKLYAPTEASDPKTYIGLWERTQDGTTSKQEVDKAMQTNKINVSDWRGLREQIYKGDIEGRNPAAKQAWDRVKILAEDTFGDRVERESFIYDLHQSAQGKSPEQIIQMANDKLKKDPNTGKWGFFQSKVWETDFKKTDAKNIAWGKAYTDIGKQETLAIGQGMSMTQKKAFTPADIDVFANQFGGYKNIQPGTPVHNAIQSLMQKAKPTTPNNIKAVLEKYPDGKF